MGAQYAVTETLDHRRLGQLPAAARPGMVAEWVSCPGCRRLCFGPRFARHLAVCPECGYHSRLSAGQRLAQLLDPDSARPLPEPAAVPDPLGFVDEQPYPQRLQRARAVTGAGCAVRGAYGTIEGHPVVAAAMDFDFIGGSLGVAEGELVTAAAEAARANRVPLLVVTASGGARMQEGALSLMQMAKTSQAFAELDEAGLLTIAVVTDPTYGGVAASFGTLADVLIAEQGARLGFAGPRVIEQTLRQRLPDGFQTAERLYANGFLDEIRPRAALRPTLAALLAAAEPPAPPPERVPAAAGAAEAVIIRDPGQLPAPEAWTVVQQARERSRPTTLEYAAGVLDGFWQLHGDRLAADCPALVGGLGRLAGMPVMLLGHQKGHTTRELAERNFGMASPAGYRKSARLLRLAGKLGCPVIALIDTPGAAPGVEAEDRGQAFAIAENLRLLSRLPVPVIAVVTGEGGSGGALALAVADRVLMLAHATYSVISPEGCAAILWRDAEAAPQAAAQLRLTAAELLRAGVVDGVVPEPGGGSGKEPQRASQLLHDALVQALDELSGMSVAELLRRRRARFREYGRAQPAGGEEVT